MVSATSAQCRYQINSIQRVNQLDDIWESARQLVESHFKQDLSENSLEVSSSPKN
jgi:hypothetical protein